MTRSLWFRAVFPMAAVVYVIVLIIADGRGQAAVIGALVLALMAMYGALVLKPAPGEGRQRNRNRNRNRAA